MMFSVLSELDYDTAFWITSLIRKLVLLKEYKKESRIEVLIWGLGDRFSDLKLLMSFTSNSNTVSSAVKPALTTSKSKHTGELGSLWCKNLHFTGHFPSFRTFCLINTFGNVYIGRNVCASIFYDISCSRFINCRKSPSIRQSKSRLHNWFYLDCNGESRIVSLRDDDLRNKIPIEIQDSPYKMHPVTWENDH